MENNNIKRGMIVRLDNGGLGFESIDFCNNIHFEKKLGVIVGTYTQYRDRFGSIPICKNLIPTNTLRDFLIGLDVVFTVETPYSTGLFMHARELGVKTVLKVNYEWLPNNYTPDVFVYPEKWYSGDNIVLQCPVDRNVIKFRLREKALRFIMMAGHKAGYDREGIALTKKANELLPPDRQVKIFDQFTYEFPTRDEVYAQGDVLIHPRRYGGQSLKLNEALASGMPVIMTDMCPQNEIIPKDWLIPTLPHMPLSITNRVECVNFDPQMLADKINSWHGQDITDKSLKASEIAEQRSWAVLKSKWESILSK